MGIVCVDEDQDDERAGEMLVPGLPHKPQPLQAGPHQATSLRLRVSQPVPQGPVRVPNPELGDRLGVVNTALAQVTQRLRRASQRLGVVIHHGGRQPGIRYLRVREQRELARDRLRHRASARRERRCLRQHAQRRRLGHQQLDREPERDPLRSHHPINRPPTPPAGPETVPQILRRRHHQARRGVIVERATPHQILALPTQLHPAPLDEPRHGHLGLESGQHLVRDTSHLRTSVTREPVKKSLRSVANIYLAISWEEFRKDASMVDTTTPMHASGSEPVTDANFAARLAAQRKTAGITQQVLADRAAIHVTQVRRYEAGTSHRLKLEALDRLDPDEQNHVTALIEGALLRHDARRHLTGQAS